MARALAMEERRSAIIAAAVRVLAREGLAEATTRKIASEAGVNQAMIAYYFGGKDELLYAVLQEMMRKTAEVAGAAQTPQRQGFAATLAGAVEAFWRHVEQAPELQIMQYELTLYALRHPESSWLAQRQYAGYCAVVAKLIGAVCEATGERPAQPPDALARFIVGGLDGLILQFISDRDTQRAHDDLRRLVAATLALAGAASAHP